MTAEQKPGSHVENAMPLASWTICSTCCEAHPSANACPRCAAPEPARKPAAASPAQEHPGRRVRMQLEKLPQPAAPSKRSLATVLTAMLFVIGLVMVVVGTLPLVGIALCALPVAVQTGIRVRERRADRAAVANLGYRLG